MVDPDALAHELRSLRKGRAARHPALATRIGPELRRLCGFDELDSPTDVRSKLTSTVQTVLRDQSPEVRLALLAALALHPETKQRTLGGREYWLAQRLHFHERTARRRVDEAIDLLAQAATEGGERPAPPPSEPWRVRSLDALLRLDTDGPELIERRTIVFTADGVGEIVCRFSVPRPADSHGRAHELRVEVLYGGRIRVRERPSDEHFLFHVELPQKFRSGNVHEYGMAFRIPAGQPMASHYVLQPLTPCDAFDLTIRFDQLRLPGLVWQLNGVAPRLVDNDRPTGDILVPDRFGQLRLSFRDLHEGRAYGVKWGTR